MYISCTCRSIFLPADAKNAYESPTLGYVAYTCLATLRQTEPSARFEIDYYFARYLSADDFCSRRQVLWLTPPGDEMSEVVSRCLPHRQLCASNLSMVVMHRPKWGSILRPFWSEAP